jgi:hypothetical protein
VGVEMILKKLGAVYGLSVAIVFIAEYLNSMGRELVMKIYSSVRMNVATDS